MKEFTLNSLVNAEVARVFAFFADFDQVGQHLSTVETMRLLTPGPVAVGSRVIQCRRVMGMLMEQEMDCVALQPDRLLAIRAHLKGTDYLTEFHFSPAGTKTRVELRFSSRPQSRLAALGAPFTCTMVSALKPLFQQDLKELADAF